MIGILLVTHGDMAPGLKNSAEMIVGEINNCSTVSLNPGEDIQEFGNQVFEQIKSLNSGEGVIVFVDLFGASPYNAVMKYVPKLAELGINIALITGVNLPMIISASCEREFTVLEDLAANSLNAGIDNMKDALKDLTIIKSEPDDDY